MNTHSIIIIKNEKNEYLQYYDKKWNCYLFLNSKMENKENMESIYNKIKEMLNIEKEDVEISFVGEKIHKKFSESDKIEKEYQGIRNSCLEIVINPCQCKEDGS